MMIAGERKKNKIYGRERNGKISSGLITKWGIKEDQSLGKYEAFYINGAPEKIV